MPSLPPTPAPRAGDVPVPRSSRDDHLDFTIPRAKVDRPGTVYESKYPRYRSNTLLMQKTKLCLTLSLRVFLFLPSSPSLLHFARVVHARTAPRACPMTRPAQHIIARMRDGYCGAVHSALHGLLQTAALLGIQPTPTTPREPTAWHKI